MPAFFHCGAENDNRCDASLLPATSFNAQTPPDVPTSPPNNRDFPRLTHALARA